MSIVLPKVIDMKILQLEILDKEASAALPSNLSDSWLERIAENINQVFENGGSPMASLYMQAPLALVLHLLFEGRKSAINKIDLDKLEDHLESYWIEIEMETVKRKTNINSSPATMETIFTNRLVEFEKRK